MDWYIVIKTINGRRYRYRQKTRRVGKRVRTKSEYISPEVIIGYHGTFAKFERFSYEHAGSPRMRQQERALIRREVVCSGRGAFEPGDFGGSARQRQPVVCRANAFAEDGKVVVNRFAREPFLEGLRLVLLDFVSGYLADRRLPEKGYQGGPQNRSFGPLLGIFVVRHNIFVEPSPGELVEGDILSFRVSVYRLTLRDPLPEDCFIGERTGSGILRTSLPVAGVVELEVHPP